MEGPHEELEGITMKWSRAERLGTCHGHREIVDRGSRCLAPQLEAEP